ncbi:hypothetical protein ACFE04_002537 [Oxalis oulophora]
MRAGLCSLQQGLTPEAANLVKQSLALARRRGHAQVTPLHVATAMLGSSTGLLRRACLQSHSHPLQCKALELCFNVALNRLPASTSSPLLGPPQYPSLSNALVAAFKRAQAHQRRGSVENQQQPILAIKIEVEQLIVSILDDPSVSRVMREAGLSSTQVKINVEQSISLEFCSQNPTPINSQSQSLTKPLELGNPTRINEDVMSVLTKLATKRKNTVIVEEYAGNAEIVIRGVMEKFERGELPGDLKYVQFVNFPLLSSSSFDKLSKDEVEKKLVELRCVVKSYMSRGVVLYLGDLRYVADFWSNNGDQREKFYYTSPLEHIVMEIKRLVSGIVEKGKFWLMGIANFQTYMKCKRGYPSLESIWQLHPLTVPVGSLSLSLKLDSDLRTDCSINFGKEVQSIVSGVHKDSANIVTLSSSSSLPSWLQKYKDESRGNIASYQECVDVRDICKKVVHFSSKSPSSSTSANSYDGKLNLHQKIQPWPVTISESKPVIKEHQFWISGIPDDENERNLIRSTNLIPDLLSNPNSSPNSASSSEAMEDMDHGFKEFNADNLMVLRDALEKKVPWQKEIISEISNTVLECRSGLNKNPRTREETLMFFLGPNSNAKEMIARELGKVIFGSQNRFVSISLSSFSSSTEESNKKRSRDELGMSYFDRFSEAMNENPHRVFLLEDFELVDLCSQKGIKKAIKKGETKLVGTETVPLKDAIVIFSCESFSSPGSKTKKEKLDDEEQLKETSIKSVSLDLNLAVVDEGTGEEHEDSVGILEYVDGKFVFKNLEV